MEEPMTDHADEGRKVWKALAGQAAEAGGFAGAMLGSLINFLKKNLPMILLCGLAGATASGILALLKPPAIRAGMTVSYALLEKKIYADMLEKLDQLAASGQYGSLSAILKISEPEAGMILSITGKNIHNQPLVKDVSTQKVPFYIEVEVKDGKILDTLQQALANYLNATPFVGDRLKINEINYANELKFLRNQMSDLDSLKHLLVTDPAGAGPSAVNSLNTLNKSRQELFSRIRDLEGALQFNRNIEVLDGFIAQTVPMKRHFAPFLLYGFLAGLAGWLILSAWRSRVS